MDPIQPENLEGLHIGDLLALCVANTDDSITWVEFLRRFSAKIRLFIHRTLRQYSESMDPSDLSQLLGGAQEADLFQSTILKLVEKDCTVMRRFSGSEEAQFLAYLAVISRSVVRDHLRLQRASKRPVFEGIPREYDPLMRQLRNDSGFLVESDSDRGILGREVLDISIRVIRKLSGPHSARNELIFQLRYAGNLSPAQIAQCRGVGLSKAGVERVLHQIRDQVRAVAGQELLEVIP